MRDADAWPAFDRGPRAASGAGDLRRARRFRSRRVAPWGSPARRCGAPDAGRAICLASRGRWRALVRCPAREPRAIADLGGVRGGACRGDARELHRGRGAPASGRVGRRRSSARRRGRRSRRASAPRSSRRECGDAPVRPRRDLPDRMGARQQHRRRPRAPGGGGRLPRARPFTMVVRGAVACASHARHDAAARVRRRYRVGARCERAHRRGQCRRSRAGAHAR